MESDTATAPIEIGVLRLFDCRPARYPDPDCRSCKGTGKMGPYGSPSPLATHHLFATGTMPVELRTCVACDVAAPGDEEHAPGHGVTYWVVETVTPGPTYPPAQRTDVYTIAIYGHAARWLRRDRDVPFLLERSGIGEVRGTHEVRAADVLRAIYPAAQVVDSSAPPPPYAGPALWSTQFTREAVARDDGGER